MRRASPTTSRQRRPPRRTRRYASSSLPFPASLCNAIDAVALGCPLPNASSSRATCVLCLSACALYREQRGRPQPPEPVRVGALKDHVAWQRERPAGSCRVALLGRLADRPVDPASTSASPPFCSVLFLQRPVHRQEGDSGKAEKGAGQVGEGVYRHDGDGREGRVGAAQGAQDDSDVPQQCGPDRNQLAGQGSRRVHASHGRVHADAS